MMTPLNSIINLSKIIIDNNNDFSMDSPASSPFDFLKYITIILKSANLLYYLIKDLSDLLKI